MSAPEQAGPQAAQPEPGPGSKSAVRQYEAELEQKERAIRESIAAKIARIHEVERQLAALHNQLHVNVAPRKQALELLRHKIEEENRQIDVHRTAYSKAKAAMEAAAAALAAAEQRKAQLSEELTMLVMQSSGAQMRKLEQLSEELEHLTTGLPTTGAAAAANGASHATASSSVAHGDAMVQVQVAAAAASQHQEQQQQEVKGGGADPAAAAADGPAAAADASTAADQQALEEARRRKLEQQRLAAAARGRHVQLGGRRAGSGSGDGSPAAAPTRIPQPPAARTSASSGSGRFEGFE